MFVHRRRLLQLAALAASPGWLPMAQIARAQSYPSKSVRFMVGFPANGPNSILAGLAGDWLAAKLGQPFAIEHKPGQSGNIATAEVVRAPADGYTILLCGPANAIGASLYPNLPYNFLRDMVPVAGITREALVLVVNPGVPAKTLPELLALTKANPRAVKIASTGSGSAPHVTAELFKQLTGLNLDVVHYAGGGPALNAIANGEAQMMFEPMSASIIPVRAGKLRALAVTTTTPSSALPGVPTVAEAVPGYDASAATGIAVPKGTPVDVVELLNKTMQTAFADPGFQAKVAETGGVPLPGSSADFARLMTAETEKWGKVVKAAGIKAE
jgi:tripartite-type tricarboxylate transporter receptor subunit TctC